MENPTLIPPSMIEVLPPTAVVTGSMDDLRPNSPNDLEVNNVDNVRIRITLSDEDIKIEEVTVNANFPLYTYVSADHFVTSLW